MALKLVTAPANYPVTLAQAKAHLRAADFTDDDVMIDALIAAAVQHCDGPKGFLGRALVSQTWDLYLDAFPCRRGDAFLRLGHRVHGCQIELPLPPLISVGGVFWLDSAGSEQEVDASTYNVDPYSEPGRVVPVNGAWPIAACVPNAVRIRFTAGYVTTDSPPADNVPKPITAAMLMYIGDLYANRETMLIGQRAAAVTLPWASEQLLRPYRFTLSVA
jgi:uncharacterized phiE125 gp8 family phage protein